MSKLNDNTISLQALLEQVNNLPEAGGMSLETCEVSVYIYSVDGFFAYTTVENGVLTPEFKSVKAGAESQKITVLKNSAVLLYAPGNSSNYYGGNNNLDDITRPGRSDEYCAFCYWVKDAGYITCQ
jgi:hypothetical protein